MIFFWGLCFLILLSVCFFLHIIIAGIHVNRDKMLPPCTKQNTNQGYGNTEIYPEIILFEQSNCIDCSGGN